VSRRAPPWWRHHFDDAYYRLHAPLFSAQQSRTETAGIIALMGLPLGARLLDVPCGWGRHAALLAEAGLTVTGADLSFDMLARAPRSLPRVAADIRALPFAAAIFDGAFDVFTSFGLFGDDREDVRALAELRRVLVPGGVFLLETMHRDEVVAAYAQHDAWTLDDGTEITVRRRFDPVSGVSRERLTWQRGGESGEKRHALRLRTATEVAALLDTAGFGDVRWFGDWSGTRLSHRSPHLIAVARKPRSLARPGTRT
jgi:ubiquinone/menaquinone biosynthesis C-methylase UbiE